MNNLKKTSVLLSGVLVVFLFSTFNSFAQKSKSKTVNVTNLHIEDSISELKAVQLEKFVHERMIKSTQQEYLSHQEKIKILRNKLDSIKSLILNFDESDTSTMQSKLLKRGYELAIIEFDYEFIEFMNVRNKITEKVNFVNDRSEYLMRREKSLTEYIDKFKKK